ncbi:hypothetical protein SAMN05216198_2007 [Halopseudomonas litoralis]|uniref:Uncharacterized protein n=1 Tax=Halopseudomonas litoralis TaxID=797277 RepID=A0A1H1SE23_9GAMM|nr:hypothetical protein SAMN05216198_2007 [Halopseudomonas litoralis]
MQNMGISCQVAPRPTVMRVQIVPTLLRGNACRDALRPDPHHLCKLPVRTLERPGRGSHAERGNHCLGAGSAPRPSAVQAASSETRR